MMCAVQNGNNEIVRFLAADMNAHLNIQSRKGQTAMMIASAQPKNRVKILEFLLQNGADPNMRSNVCLLCTHSSHTTHVYYSTLFTLCLSVSLCLCVSVKQTGDSALILSMMFGAPENSSFLVDQKITPLNKEIIDDAVSRANEFGVPKIIMKILRQKVCCVCVCVSVLSVVCDESCDESC